MPYAIGVVAIVVFIATTWAALSGRLRLTSCCSIADPANDLRMRAAFAPDRDTQEPSI